MIWKAPETEIMFHLTNFSERCQAIKVICNYPCQRDGTPKNWVITKKRNLIKLIDFDHLSGSDANRIRKQPPRQKKPSWPSLRNDVKSQSYLSRLQVKPQIRPINVRPKSSAKFLEATFGVLSPPVFSSSKRVTERFSDTNQRGQSRAKIPAHWLRLVLPRPVSELNSPGITHDRSPGWLNRRVSPQHAWWWLRSDEPVIEVSTDGTAGTHDGVIWGLRCFRK